MQTHPNGMIAGLGQEREPKAKYAALVRRVTSGALHVFARGHSLGKIPAHRAAALSGHPHLDVRRFLGAHDAHRRNQPLAFASIPFL